MNEIEELNLDGIFDLEDLRDESSTTEVRKMDWIYELFLYGEVPEKYRNNLAEFCKQFHTPEFAPGNILFNGHNYTVAFANRREKVSDWKNSEKRVKLALDLLMSVYEDKAEELGIEGPALDMTIDGNDEIEVTEETVFGDILIDFKELYGAKNGDTFFAQGSYDYELIYMQDGFLDVDKKMPEEHRKNQSRCYIYSPHEREETITDYLSKAISRAIKAGCFVESVQYSDMAESITVLLQDRIEKSKEGELIFVNDIALVSEYLDFHEIQNQISSMSDVGKVIVTDYACEMMVDIMDIDSLDEFKLMDSYYYSIY